MASCFLLLPALSSLAAPAEGIEELQLIGKGNVQFTLEAPP